MENISVWHYVIRDSADVALEILADVLFYVAKMRQREIAPAGNVFCCNCKFPTNHLKGARN